MLGLGENIRNTVSISEKSKIILTAVEERDKLFAEAAEIEKQQRKHLDAVFALAKQHTNVLAKMAVLEQLIESV